MREKNYLPNEEEETELLAKDVFTFFFFLLAEPTTVPMLGSAFPGTTLGESFSF